MTTANHGRPQWMQMARVLFLVIHRVRLLPPVREIHHCTLSRLKNGTAWQGAQFPVWMNLERDQRKDRRKCRGPFPPSGTFTQWQLLTLKLGNFKLLLAVLITAETFSRFYTQKKEDMKLLEPQLIN
jgi:hypothetical protein